MTAAELVAQLRADPEFVAGEAEREREMAAASVEFRAAAKPLLDELEAAGIRTNGFGKFVSPHGAKYIYVPPFDHVRSVPILLKWLPRIENERVKHAIVGHLGTKHARGVAAPVLIDEFEQTPNELDSLKWSIGSALEVVADDSVFDDVVRLARDKRHGCSREMIVGALGNMKNHAAVRVLVELLDDEEVAGQALWGLRKLAPVEARPHIERFVNHPTTWIRNEAKKAVAKIEKKQARASG